MEEKNSCQASDIEISFIHLFFYTNEIPDKYYPLSRHGIFILQEYLGNANTNVPDPTTQWKNADPDPKH